VRVDPIIRYGQYGGSGIEPRPGADNDSTCEVRRHEEFRKR